MSELITSFPMRNVKGQLTLAGALNKYWDIISVQWQADSTISGNVADYERRILEVADKFKGINDYTYEECEDIVKILSSRGNYGESTENHYRHLLRLVMEACYLENEIKNEPYSDNEAKQIGNRNLVKSFTKDECDLITDWCLQLKPENVRGSEIAVAVMYGCGLRNQEAGGLKFGGFKYNETLDCHLMMVIWTLVGTSRNIKLRGKTRNATRIVPCIFKPIINLIEGRREILMKQFNSKDIDQLPICFADKDVTQHCTIQEINDTAKAVFKLLGIKGNTWRGLFNSAEDVERIRMTIRDEKDPTAYAFRRNAATRYYSMGLNLVQLQYIMGHEIEHPAVVRSDFLNEDMMKPLVEKIKKYKW